MSKALKNPFDPVAHEETSDFFVAESEELRNFKNYIAESVEKGRNFSIVGDYGQGKSRMLFYLLKKYKIYPNTIFSFISIKTTKADMTGKDWQEKLFQRLLNVVIEDVRERYESNPKIPLIVAKLKNEIIESEDIKNIDELIPYHREKLEKSVGKEKEKVQSTLEQLEKRKKDILEHEELTPTEFFEKFLPAFLKILRELGIEHFFIFFDEMEHLSEDYLQGRAKPFEDFISRFREIGGDKYRGLHIGIACARRIWTEFERDRPEFTSVYSPSRPEINVIPKFGFDDLKVIIQLNLKKIGQEKENPFSEMTVKNIARYNTFLRSCIKICYELYNIYIENPQKDIDKVFEGRYYDALVDSARIENAILGTIEYFSEHYPTMKKFKKEISKILKKIALHEEFASKRFIQEWDRLLPGSGPEIFKYWCEEKAYVMPHGEREDTYTLNIDKFRRREEYVGIVIKEFYNELWNKRDTENNGIDRNSAKKLFEEFKKENKDVREDFNVVVNELTEGNFIIADKEALFLRKTVGMGIDDQIDAYIKRIKKEPDYPDKILNNLIPSLLKYCFEPPRKCSLQKDSCITGTRRYILRYFVTTQPVSKYKLFNKEFRIAFFLPEESIASNILREKIRCILSKSEFVYVIWPFEECDFVLDKDEFEREKDVRDTYCKNFKLNQAFDDDVRENAEIFVIYSNKKAGFLSSFIIDYLTLREELEINVDKSVERLKEVDDYLQKSIKDPILEKMSGFEEELKECLPIKTSFLKPSPGVESDILKYVEILMELNENGESIRGNRNVSLFKNILGYSFIEVEGSKSNPKQIIFKSLDEKYEAKAIPTGLKQIIDAMGTEDYEKPSEIAKKLFESQGDFNFIEGNYDGKESARWGTTLKPILLMLSKAFEGKILTDEEREKFKIASIGLPRETFNELKETSIPLLKNLEIYGIDLPRNIETQLVLDEIGDLEKSIIPQISERIENDEAYIDITDKKEQSLLSRGIITNQERIELLTELAKEILTKMKKWLISLPSKSYTKNPSKVIRKEDREISLSLPPKIYTIIANINLILDKKKVLENIKELEIAKGDVEELFCSLDSYKELIKEEKEMKTLQDKILENIDQIPEYSNIKIKDETPYTEIFTITKSLSNPKESLALFQQIAIDKKLLDEKLGNILKLFNNLPSDFAKVLRDQKDEILDFQGNVINVGISGMETLSTIEINKMEEEIDKLSKIEELSQLPLEDIDNSLLQLVLLYFKNEKRLEKMKNEVKKIIDESMDEPKKQFIKNAKAIVEFSKKQQWTFQKIEFIEKDKIEWIDDMKNKYTESLFSGEQRSSINELEEWVKTYIQNQIKELNENLDEVLKPEIKEEVKKVRKAQEEKKLFGYLWKKVENQSFKETMQLLKEMEEVGYL